MFEFLFKRPGDKPGDKPAADGAGAGAQAEPAAPASASQRALQAERLSQIQGDELRVQSKSRDDLQATMALLKKADLDVDLQFVNLR